MKIRSPWKNPVVYALMFAGFLACACAVFPWAAFIGVERFTSISGSAETHQIILREAYNLLSWDPGMGRFNGRISFPGRRQVEIDHILTYEGVYGNPVFLEAYGPGPDADGATHYSLHWYNPLTGQGFAPQAAYNQYLPFVNAVSGNGNVDEHALRGIAWSAHFIADMFVPYHVVGLSLSEAAARMNNRNYFLGENEVGPLYLYSPDPPSRDVTGILKFPTEIVRNWWRDGWGVNNDYRNAFAVFWDKRMDAGANVQENPIDWFDPWYWNGLPSRDLLSSHASYESRAHSLWIQGSGYQRGFDGGGDYDPLWRNAPPDYSFQAHPRQAQAWQVQDFAAKIARRTRQNLEVYWRAPNLAIQGAVRAVYTLWRSAFSALETDIRIEADPERIDAYFIRAAVRNSAYEPCRNVQVRLTVQKGGEIVLQNGSALTGPLGRGSPQDVTWHIQMKPDLSTTYVFTAETMGSFVQTPDLQYAADTISYQPREAEEEVEEQSDYAGPLRFEGVDFVQGQRAFADVVAGFQAGEATTGQYAVAGNALGPPDFNERETNTHTALGHNGVLVVGFSKVWLVDGPGPDLYVFEIGAMIEPFKVEISSDGASWVDLGIVRGQPAMLDIAGRGAPGQGFTFVRITDNGSHMSGSPYAGSDIDAVGAINAVQKR